MAEFQRGFINSVEFIHVDFTAAEWAAFQVAPFAWLAANDPNQVMLGVLNPGEPLSISMFLSNYGQRGPLNLCESDPSGVITPNGTGHLCVCTPVAMLQSNIVHCFQNVNLERDSI